MTDENNKPVEGAEAAPETAPEVVEPEAVVAEAETVVVEAEPVPAPAPEGWDQAFGADAPKPSGAGAAWQPKDEGATGAYGAAPTQPTEPYSTGAAGSAGGNVPPQQPYGGNWQAAPAPEPIPTTAYAKSCLSAGWADCKQPGFWKKTAFLGLVECVPILNFVNAGYMLEWSKEVPFGGRTPLPKKVVTGRNFEIGFYAFVIALVFSLVSGLVGGILGWIPLVGWIAAVVVGFLVAMFTNILQLRMAMRSQLGEGFKIGDAWTAIKRDWSGLLWACIAPSLIAAGVILVASFVYMIVAFIALIPIAATAAVPDPTYMVGAILGGGFGFLLVTAVFCYLCAWASAAAQLVVIRSCAHWVARYAGEWTYLA